MTDSIGSVISRQFTGWHKVAALAPALLLLVYLPAQMMLRCRIDGFLRTECCCSHDKEPQPSGPAVKAQDCCDREVAHSQRPKADVARSSRCDFGATAALVLLVPFAPVVLPPVVRFDGAAQRHGPAREGPPLVLLKHAFLI